MKMNKKKGNRHHLEWEYLIQIKWAFKIYMKNKIEWYDGWMPNDVLVLLI